MATYELEKIIKLWEVEKLTTEQAIGQMLQVIQELQGQLREVQKRLRELERRQEDRPMPRL
jgi:chaperonin cofactor prefoldin